MNSNLGRRRNKGREAIFGLSWGDLVHGTVNKSREQALHPHLGGKKMKEIEVFRKILPWFLNES